MKFGPVVWKEMSFKMPDDGRQTTDGRQTKSDRNTSPLAFGSGELKYDDAIQ